MDFAVLPPGGDERASTTTLIFHTKFELPGDWGFEPPIGIVTPSLFSVLHPGGVGGYSLALAPKIKF